MKTPVTRLAVILGEPSADTSRTAVALSVLATKPEITDAYGPVEVVQVSDIGAALNFWKDSNFERLAGFFINPASSEAKPFGRILREIDQPLTSRVDCGYFINQDGSVDQARLEESLKRILRNYQQTIEQPGTETALTPDSLLNVIITLAAGEQALATWVARYVDLTGYKILAPPEASRRKKSLQQVSAGEVEKLAGKIRETLPKAESVDPSRRIFMDPSDPRYAGEELESIVKMLINSEGGVTRFMEHATGGVVGLFPQDRVFSPEEQALFIKVYRGLEEVEGVFRRYYDLKRQRRDLEHKPLVVSSLGEGQYAVLSEARVVTLTGDIAKTLRAANPELARIFVTETVSVGIDRLVEHKNAVKRSLNERQQARILEDYKLKMLTAWRDLHLAGGKEADSSMFGLYRFALDLLDYKVDDGWDAFLFGPLMDWKVHNDGLVTGNLHPTFGQLERFLLGASPDDSRADASSARTTQLIRARIKETRALLEYDGRDGSVLEDFFHVINSAELAIPEKSKPDYYRRLLLRLYGLDVKDALPTDASRLWQAYFAMETSKSTRKVQRTLHYIAAGGPYERYESEMQHYGRQMVKAPWAAYMFFQDPISRTEDINAQLRLVSQLYDAQDQWGLLGSKEPAELNLTRWAAWTCANKYLSAIEPKPELLKCFQVSR